MGFFEESPQQQQEQQEQQQRCVAIWNQFRIQKISSLTRLNA